MLDNRKSRQTLSPDVGSWEGRVEGGGVPDEMVVPEEALGATSCYKIESKNIRFVYCVLYSTHIRGHRREGQNPTGSLQKHPLRAGGA